MESWRIYVEINCFKQLHQLVLLSFKIWFNEQFSVKGLNFIIFQLCGTQNWFTVSVKFDVIKFVIAMKNCWDLLKKSCWGLNKTSLYLSFCYNRVQVLLNTSTFLIKKHKISNNKKGLIFYWYTVFILDVLYLYPIRS